MNAIQFSKTTLYLVVFVILAGCMNNNQSTSLGVKNTELGDPPGTYKITNNKDEVKIPFEFFGMNPMVCGEINGKKVKFLIDNGILWDQIWFYNGEVDSINLFYKKDLESMELSGEGEDGNTSIKEANDIDVSFGEVQFLNQPSLVSPKEAGYDKLFPGMNGQISALLFKHFIVTFNFDENILILTKPEKFKPANKGQAIPMRLGNFGQYYIPFTLQLDDSTEQELNLNIDIGTVFSLYLIENEKNNIRIPENSEKSLIGYGASGAIYGHDGMIKKVSIGNYTLENVFAKIIEKAEGSDSNPVDIGTFGLPLMKRFNITFDYFNQLMYFKPNTHFTETFVD